MVSGVNLGLYQRRHCPLNIYLILFHLIIQAIFVAWQAVDALWNAKKCLKPQNTSLRMATVPSVHNKWEPTDVNNVTILQLLSFFLNQNKENENTQQCQRYLVAKSCFINKMFVCIMCNNPPFVRQKHVLYSKISNSLIIDEQISE